MPESVHDPSSKVISLASRTRAREPASHEHESVAQPRQLEFGFGRERNVVFVATDKIHGATFLRGVLDTRPVTLFDLRFAPHFEFTAVSASAAIGALNKMGVRYIQRGVAFHDFQANILRYNPGQLALDLLSLGYGSSPARGPLMILVQHMSDAEAFRPYLVGLIERTDGAPWTVNFVK